MVNFYVFTFYILDRRGLEASVCQSLGLSVWVTFLGWVLARSLSERRGRSECPEGSTVISLRQRPRGEIARSVDRGEGRSGTARQGSAIP